MKSVDARPAPVEQHPGTTWLAIGLPQDADEHRSENGGAPWGGQRGFLVGPVGA
jgi:hypothetical protein